MSQAVASTTRRIRHANMDDFAAMQQIYAHARQIMRDNGNASQWGTTYPTDSIIEADIRERRAMLLVDNEGPDGAERILAQFALCPGPDPAYAHIEGAWLDDDPYVAIHRVASAGVEHRAARDAIAWVVQHYGNVRADTHAHNKLMQHALETSGFARCGLITLPDHSSDAIRIAYQRHEW
ncbi:histone acetyltransferase [Bifidobacterium dolichotidis]|uniref:Histone acetyltransferase n=1 Tax=Bifidobacterium dolichotidis TaxID=2306976 RepID=A0A430FPR1_9BIFI|nr:N-acetyltransferase [Bifidobacterium dolichotidis]RSX54830.1 histone acetyltransferase [Bifidobacterium dolichotidis]